MKIKALLLTFFVATLSLFGASTDYAQKNVVSIDIVPQNLPEDYAFNPLEVRAQMHTKEGSLFLQNEFDQDLKALSEQYDRIEPSFLPEEDGLHILLDIWIKPTIHSITFKGNERISTKKLAKKLEIKSGDIFERGEFVDKFNELKNLYVKKGFFESTLNFCVIPVASGSEVEIEISIDEGRLGRIKAVEFTGLTPKEEKELLENMITCKYNILYSWFLGTGTYKQEVIDHDRMSIVQFLQDRGFADAYAEIEIIDSEEDGRIILNINVDKGTPYTFGKVDFVGNEIVGNEDIWNLINFRADYTYSPELLRSSLKAIQDLYQSRGYIDTAIDAQLNVRETEPIYDITFVIEEGTQYRVGLVRVFGNSTTKTGVILHENLLCPGEVFDMRRLEGTEQRLTNTGFFKAVNVYPVQSTVALPEENICYRDVYIEVEECDTGSIGAFCGFSTLDRLFGGLEFSECNFNITGIPAFLKYGPRALRGGGEYLHMKASVGDKTTEYLLQWTKPYFLDTPWIVGFDIERANNRAISHEYEIKSYGGHLHASYVFNDFLRWSLTYRAQNTHNTLRDRRNSELDEQASISGLISAFGGALCYDSTNSPRCPTYGLRSKLFAEVAGLGGDFRFSKMGYMNTLYYPIFSRGVLKLRGDLQFISTFGGTRPEGLPLAERFYLGGENTVRGYRPYIIGPLFQPNVPKGGVSCLLLSEEYQYHLFPRVDAFVFVDAGYVSLREFTIGQLRSSYGFGFRVEAVKNLPFTIGYGFPIKASRDETQNFFFSVGGTF